MLPCRNPVALACVVLLACTRKDEVRPTGAWLEADWTGTDTGRISAPATAEWCDSLGVLEIRAVQGDTGIALAIHSPISPGSGRYPVRPPAGTDSVRQRAALAVRWFAETAIKGFRGDSGEVRLERSTSGIVSGGFSAELSAVNATDRLSIRGKYRDLEVSPATRGCARRPPGSAADTGVN
jgi:hypothetical protein